MKTRILSVLFAFTIFTFWGSAQNINPDRQWFMYRGNYASGVLDHADLPEKWDESTGENIAWKTVIPGLAHSCPVI